MITQEDATAAEIVGRIAAVLARQDQTLKTLQRGLAFLAQRAAKKTAVTAASTSSDTAPAASTVASTAGPEEAKQAASVGTAVASGVVHSTVVVTVPSVNTSGCQATPSLHSAATHSSPHAIAAAPIADCDQQQSSPVVIRPKLSLRFPPAGISASRRSSGAGPVSSRSLKRVGSSRAQIVVSDVIQKVKHIVQKQQQFVEADSRALVRADTHLDSHADAILPSAVAAVGDDANDHRSSKPRRKTIVASAVAQSIADSKWDGSSRLRELEDIQASNSRAAFVRTHSAAAFSRTHSVKSANKQQASPSRSDTFHAAVHADPAEGVARASCGGDAAAHRESPAPAAARLGRLERPLGVVGGASTTSKKLSKFPVQTPRARVFVKRLANAVIQQQELQLAATALAQRQQSAGQPPSRTSSPVDTRSAPRGDKSVASQHVLDKGQTSVGKPAARISKPSVKPPWSSTIKVPVVKEPPPLTRPPTAAKEKKPPR